MEFAAWLILQETKIEGYGGEKILKNPSLGELFSFLQSITTDSRYEPLFSRGVLDEKNDIYIWNGNDFEHRDVDSHIPSIATDSRGRSLVAFYLTKRGYELTEKIESNVGIVNVSDGSSQYKGRSGVSALKQNRHFTNMLNMKKEQSPKEKEQVKQDVQNWVLKQKQKKRDDEETGVAPDLRQNFIDKARRNDYQWQV